MFHANSCFGYLLVLGVMQGFPEAQNACMLCLHKLDKIWQARGDVTLKRSNFTKLCQKSIHPQDDDKRNLGRNKSSIFCEKHLNLHN